MRAWYMFYEWMHEKSSVWEDEQRKPWELKFKISLDVLVSSAKMHTTRITCFVKLWTAHCNPFSARVLTVPFPVHKAWSEPIWVVEYTPAYRGVLTYSMVSNQYSACFRVHRMKQFGTKQTVITSFVLQCSSSLNLMLPSLLFQLILFLIKCVTCTAGPGNNLQWTSMQSSLMHHAVICLSHDSTRLKDPPILCRNIT